MLEKVLNKFVSRWTKSIVLLVAIASFLGGFVLDGLVRDYLPGPGLYARQSAVAVAPEVESAPLVARVENRPQALNAPGEVYPETIYQVDADDDPSFGPADAPVTIIEFTDYQCPFCTRFYKDTLGQILSTYEGRVRYVVRDFPLDSIHPNAVLAAEASECADDQGKFWQMHDALYDRQTEWGQAADVMNEFEMMAQKLELDIARFSNCLSQHVHRNEVFADKQAAVATGITGTPSFFINGKKVVGAKSFDVFAQLIEAEL
jgi:protein-disulfide isomerase